MTSEQPNPPPPIDTPPAMCPDCKLAHLHWRARRAAVALMQSAMDEGEPSIGALREAGRTVNALLAFVAEHPDTQNEALASSDLRYTVGALKGLV